MTIVRWDPLRNVATLQDRINRIFNEAFADSKDFEDEVSMSAWRPVVDIFDTNNAIVIKAELPGIKKDDVSVDVKDNVLTIKGERSLSKEIKEENYYRKERSFGKFQRSFTLPEAIEPAGIKANFKNGVLEIEVPKAEEKKPKQISINVE
ncbi:MAG: Hsp20/alpha crystallin family protein [Proteobacteria bacterium]|nr:Hsp20/alpha crystallin family protein [Desulfobacteraceae bacterium]MBU2521139.1 Hsp20/alpha crystallin family protein [Pseudomonadota bacterium]MBU3980872.1 Hsp20/alpha crystallin family protein [Pseudomonadota bacterium]MBU4013165.1 Hsp20/alpha crystallin family protein [Pseudomonadota bacterium]MBU4067233.1 Hsp20/alpha crystallin family protein [Pseudomonadota bacterium]